MIQQVRGTVRAVKPQELLRMARRLLGLGFHLPAAMLARAALETILVDSMPRLGVEVPYNRRSVQDRVRLLQRAGLLDSDHARHTRRLAALGNLACHNYVVTHSEVLELLEGVETFMGQLDSSTESEGRP